MARSWKPGRLEAILAFLTERHGLVNANAADAAELVALGLSKKTRTRSCRIEPITARLPTSRRFAVCPDSMSIGWMPYGSEWPFATEAQAQGGV